MNRLNKEQLITNIKTALDAITNTMDDWGQDIESQLVSKTTECAILSADNQKQEEKLEELCTSHNDLQYWKDKYNSEKETNEILRMDLEQSESCLKSMHAEMNSVLEDKESFKNYARKTIDNYMANFNCKHNQVEKLETQIQNMKCSERHVKASDYYTLMERHKRTLKALNEKHVLMDFQLPGLESI